MRPTGRGEAEMVDNLVLTQSGAPGTQISGGISRVTRSRMVVQGLTFRRTSLSPDEQKSLQMRGAPAPELARDMVLNHSGARPAERDSVDLRLVAEVRAGKGHHINSQDEVGGYPQTTPTHRPLQVPKTNFYTWLSRYSAEVEQVSTP